MLTPILALALSVGWLIGHIHGYQRALRDVRERMLNGRRG